MFFCFTFGTQDFSGPADSQGAQFVCSGCGRHDAYVWNHRKFFTFCFVPIIPYEWDKEFRCRACQYHRATSGSEIKQIKKNGPVPSGYQQGPQQPGGFQPPQAGYGQQFQQPGYPQPPQAGYSQQPQPQYK